MANSIVQVLQTTPNSAWHSPEIVIEGDNAKQVYLFEDINKKMNLFLIDADNKLYYSTQIEAGGHKFGPKLPMNGTAKQIVVDANQDGRLMMIYVSANDGIYTFTQASPGSGWLGSAFGGQAKQLALSRNADGRLALIYIGMDDKIYCFFQTSPGDVAWQNIAFSGSAKQIAMAQNMDGRLELLYIGMNDRIYHCWQTKPNATSWGSERLDGAAKRISLTRNADGRLQLFYVGMDNHIYMDSQKSPGGSWHGSSSYPGFASAIATAHDADGRIELFYIGLDGYIYHSKQNDLNGPFTGDARTYIGSLPATITSSFGLIQIAFVGTTDTPPVNASLDFSFNPIVFGDGVAAGGATHLTVRQDGTYTFSGHLHDSGAAEYNTAVAWVVKDTNNIAYTLEHTGSISGTLEKGSRDDIWSVDSNNSDIAKNWNAISNRNYAVSKASVKQDIADVLNLGLAVAGIILAIIPLIFHGDKNAPNPGSSTAT